jgi:hypothetical protein
MSGNKTETEAADVELTEGSADDPASLIEFPSADDACPHEQGGPIARIGFSYQDEIAVSFLLEMLQSPALLKVHCETQSGLVAA